VFARVGAPPRQADGGPIVERKEAPEMLKRLFLAVLGFWLLKKYVLPYFDGSRDQAATEE
jgi:hypothetical protein